LFGTKESELEKEFAVREEIESIVRLLTITLLFSTLLFSTSWAGGWYLMVAPPKDSKAEHKPDLSWPLNHWEQVKSFDSANACEARRARELSSHAALVAAASVKPNEPFDDALIDATEQFILNGDSSKIPTGMVGPVARALIAFKPGYLCISTDDPRLNETPVPRDRARSEK
jgi:hypothetical protein